MRETRILMTLTTALLAALLAGDAAAQSQAYQLGAEALNGDDYGWAVADAGDVDGDGHADVVVGAHNHDANGSSSGSVFVYSGRTGGLIWTRAGENPSDLFGWAVDGVGDLDGDGKSEIIASAPLFDFPGGQANGGKIYLLRGSDGSAWATWFVNQSAAQLGSCVRGLGDIDGDGIGDFAYGSAFYDNGGLADCGRIDVYSGAAITNIFVRYGNESGAKYGQSLDIVRATGAQATSRLIVGEPGVDGAGTDRGQARLIDGFGNNVSFFPGATNIGLTGSCVAGLGDVNNDGWEDYAIGTPYADILFVGTDAGSVAVYSGASTSQLYVVNGPGPGAMFGKALAGCGDFNGDGRNDFLLGAPDYNAGGVNDAGEVRVVSGLNGSTLASWQGGLNDHMGRSVSAAGDLNLDGLTDLVFGAPDAPFGAGEAYVVLSGLAEPSIYCVAKLNSQGCIPQISWQGLASLSIADDFHVDAQNVVNQKNGLMFWGLASANLPFQGGTLCVQPPLRRTSVQSSGGSTMGSDCSGTYSFHVSHAYMAAQGIAAGDRIHAQFWSRDPTATFQVGLTDAVAFDVAP